MAQLIDVLLVTFAVAAAVWYTVKYFYNLGKTPKGGAVNCHGCNSLCHAGIPDNPSFGLLKQLKQLK